MARIEATVGRVAAGLVLCLGLAACSGAGDGTSEQEAVADNSSTAPVAAEERVAPTDLPVAPKLKKAKGAVGDVEIGECSTEAGEQSVSGTITSAREKKRDYVVTLSWINDDSDVRGCVVVVEKRVEPGELREWAATARVDEGATQCVPNVQAGKLRKPTG